MKKILTLLLAVSLSFGGFSQVIGSYSWDFTTLTSSTFPTGFVTWNLDGATVSTTYLSTAFNSPNGWIVFPAGGGYSGVAACASTFTNTSIRCDRWLVTSDMIVPTGMPNVCLLWNASSLGLQIDGSTLDNYEVRISTTDSSTGAFEVGPGNLLQTITGEQGQTRIIPLAGYAGQRIRIAFRDNTLNGYGLLMNDIEMINLPSFSATINDVRIYEHNYIGNAVPVTGTMSNNGFDTINTFTLNYSVNGAAPVTSSVTGAGLLPQLSYYYTHSVPFNPTTAGTYTLQVWFSDMNGTSAVSDTSSVTLFYYPQVSGLVKNVVVEEMTGAGCPWCPGGALALRDVHNNLSYVIPVAIHSADINDLSVSPADAMQINDGETICNTYASGFPSGMVDRLYTFDNGTISPSFWNNYYEGPSDVNQLIWDTLAVFRHKNATPVNVSLSNLSIDSSGSSWNVSVNVNATFLNGLSQGTYNMNLYVVEDSLIITGNGYDQDNGAYSSAGSGVYQNELYSLPAVLIDNGHVDEWSQNHVLRLMAGGPWGTTGIIPSAPAQGVTYTNTYTVTLDPTWRVKYTHLVGLVQEYNTNPNLRTILNGTEMYVTGSPEGIKVTSELNKLSVYPNPASSTATVELDMKDNAMATISVINALGQTVVEPSNNLLNAGVHSINIPVGDLSTGLYMVKVSINGEVTSMPLSISAK